MRYIFMISKVHKFLQRKKHASQKQETSFLKMHPVFPADRVIESGIVDKR